jgi:hypothetical protein
VSDRVTRERHSALSAVVDRIAPAGDDCSAARLVTTTTVTTYPTGASSFFAANPTEIDGTEVEGGAATYAVDTTQVVYVLNEGTAVPPNGTRVIAHAVGGRLVFRYDG